MDKPGGHDDKWDKPEKDLLYELFYVEFRNAHILEPGNRKVVEEWGGKWGTPVNGYGLLVTVRWSSGDVTYSSDDSYHYCVDCGTDNCKDRKSTWKLCEAVAGLMNLIVAVISFFSFCGGEGGREPQTGSMPSTQPEAGLDLRALPS